MRPQGCHGMFAPTGFGKTFAALSFALHHGARPASHASFGPKAACAAADLRDLVASGVTDPKAACAAADASTWMTTLFLNPKAACAAADPDIRY